MDRRISLLVSLGITAALLVGCSTTPAASTTTASPAAPTATARAQMDIVDTAVANGSFTTLAKLLGSAGLVATLKGTGPFTVFAPTDDAFAKLDKATLDSLAMDPAKLKAVLTYHVVSGKVLAADVKSGLVQTVAGSPFTVSINGTSVMIDNAKLIKTDVLASNGVIHVIDSVLIPASLSQKDIVDTAVAAGGFTTLAKLLTSAGLINTLKGAGPFTVFAPTDEAFSKIDKATLDAIAGDPAKLKAVLTYHVIAGRVLAADVKAGAAQTVADQPITIATQGGVVMVNNAKVIKTDVLASNGVIHVIDTVLLPKL
ncbi:MAG TPA: fasciclin domain-containing protein [Candidatus Limnocylindria bacterium]